jgi:hypothetical protein
VLPLVLRQGPPALGDDGELCAHRHLAGRARVGGDDKRAADLAVAPVHRDVEPFLARLRDVEDFRQLAGVRVGGGGMGDYSVRCREILSWET